ncbi:MAG TPA: FHA domain-containing protein [Verrucomicrobiae bacterium]|jgi:pSer/pThr/pTyr-binding forkhead associated (FHA) protein
MIIRITITTDSRKEVREFRQTEVFIGRKNRHARTDLDLAPDPAVSRTHARVWFDDGRHWIEDLQSRHGTYVNGVRINYARQLYPGDAIRIGSTELCVEVPVARSPREAPERSEVKVEHALDAEDAARDSMPGSDARTREKMALLMELPALFNAQRDSATLLQTVVERVVKVIPGAIHGAVLLCDWESDSLVLKASWPKEPFVSQTLARRALKEGRAFIWSRLRDGNASESIGRAGLRTGMYAPMLWKDSPLGVLCVDNPDRDAVFQKDDLQLLLAVAGYAATAIGAR